MKPTFRPPFDAYLHDLLVLASRHTDMQDLLIALTTLRDLRNEFEADLDAAAALTRLVKAI